MANQGFLELSLLSVDGQPAADRSTFISFRRSIDNTEIQSFTRSFPPMRRFALDAFPAERAIATVITPERYRHREVGIFTFTEGETIRRAPTVFRIPQKWEAKFDKWLDLTDAHRPLRDVLEAS